MEKRTTKDRTYSLEIGKVTVEVPLEADSCLLCANEIKTVAIGECGHRVICFVCILRLRWVIKKKSCPVCKAPLDVLIVTSSKTAKFEDLLSRKHELIEDKFDANVYYDDKEAYDYITRIRDYYCLEKDCDKKLFDQKSLESHLNSVHNRTICDVCFKNRPVFIGEQLIFPIHKLQDHMKYGENRGDLMIRPHPLCTFCNKYFYTEEPLLNHLSKIHMNCHLCSDQFKYKYYRDYSELEKHFQKSHYLCLNELCRAKCFVVFGTLEELHIHNHKEHGAAGPTKGLTLDALKVGLFQSSDDVPSKSGVNDGIGIDFGHYFSNEYYQQLQEERDAKEGKHEQFHKGEHYRGEHRGRGRRGGRRGGRGGNYYQKKDYEPEPEPLKEEKKVTKSIEMNKETSTLAPLPKEKCIENLRNQIYNIIKKKLAIIGIQKAECTFEKEQLFQLCKLIDSMSIENIAQCEFLMNFGVSLSLKKHLSYLIQNNDGNVEDEDELSILTLRELLIIYKYLDIAVQKIHKKFIRHDLNEINTDLLADFKEQKQQVKQIKTAIDYRDALKPKIDFEDAKSFPEFEKKAKKPTQRQQVPTNVWRKADNPLVKKPEVAVEKQKKTLEDEFPAFPAAPKPQKTITTPPKEIKRVEEVRKIPESEAFPTFKEAEKKEVEKEQGKPKSKRDRKKNKGKPEADIQIGFY